MLRLDWMTRHLVKRTANAYVTLGIFAFFGADALPHIGVPGAIAYAQYAGMALGFWIMLRPWTLLLMRKWEPFLSELVLR